jgi:hypothetical protein
MNIDPEGQLPFIVADVLDLLEAGLVRGVVDQNVDGAELLYRLVDECTAMLGILDTRCCSVPGLAIEARGVRQPE